MKILIRSDFVKPYGRHKSSIFRGIQRRLIRHSRLARSPSVTARRVNVNAAFVNKYKPFGCEPTFSDKLVQEALRTILEAVYEPTFLNVSHGFRPKRSCHTALKFIKMEFNGARWFVEGDIKGCFDNIDHQLLVGLIRNKIKDARIIKLIYKFLKAGYM